MGEKRNSRNQTIGPLCEWWWILIPSHTRPSRTISLGQNQGWRKISRYSSIEMPHSINQPHEGEVYWRYSRDVGTASLHQTNGQNNFILTVTSTRRQFYDHWWIQTHSWILCFYDMQAWGFAGVWINTHGTYLGCTTTRCDNSTSIRRNDCSSASTIWYTVQGSNRKHYHDKRM